ncbi:MAG: hypothetical protein HQK49_02990 [Oligoflexia bacterium]|nr:hypothetical protein [Oligoflexia bacterium]
MKQKFYTDHSKSDLLLNQNQNKNKNKNTLLLTLLIIMSLFFLSSCDKKNTVDGNQVQAKANGNNPSTGTGGTIGTGGIGGTTTLPGTVPNQGVFDAQSYVNQEMLTQINSAMGRYPCRNNGYRVTKNFFVPITVSPIDPFIAYNAVLQEGVGPTGKISKVFMGVLPTINDLLIVREISQGDKIVARAITVSLCYYSPLIINERPLDVRMVSDLTLKNNTACVVGDVQGKFVISAAAYLAYPAYMNMPEIFTYFPSGVCSTTPVLY